MKNNLDLSDMSVPMPKGYVGAATRLPSLTRIDRSLMCRVAGVREVGQVVSMRTVSSTCVIAAKARTDSSVYSRL